MRKGTQAFISVLSLGVVAAGYQVGQAVEVNNFASPAAAASPATADATGGTSAATTEQTAPVVVESKAAAIDSSVGSTAAPATQTAPITKEPVATSTPVSAPKATTPAVGNGGSSSTKNGAAVPYRFGTVQVSVTKANGSITAVNLLQAGATGGRDAAFSYLVDLAIQANGSGFGNLGGATYTVDAFKQSLESALAKF